MRQPAEVGEVEVAALAARNGADLLAEEPRDVGEDTDDEDAEERERGEGPADYLAGVQRVADAHVAADGHRDGQPRAGHDESVDRKWKYGRFAHAQ